MFPSNLHHVQTVPNLFMTFFFHCHHLCSNVFEVIQIMIWTWCLKNKTYPAHRVDIFVFKSINTCSILAFQKICLWFIAPTMQRSPISLSYPAMCVVSLIQPNDVHHSERIRKYCVPEFIYYPSVPLKLPWEPKAHLHRRETSPCAPNDNAWREVFEGGLRFVSGISVNKCVPRTVPRMRSPPQFIT